MLALAAVSAQSRAATTLFDGPSFGANIGWNYADATSSGSVLAGYLFSANTGWIHLGDGAPVNGVRYQNNSATDFGVNLDVAGNLSGFAWSANLGWLTFTDRAADGSSFAGPRLDLATRKFSGYVWSANAGWIDLTPSPPAGERPTAPQNLIGRAKLWHINLRWVGSVEATGYIVFRRLDSETDFAQIVETAKTVLVDDLPAQATSAEYYVVAKNDFGMSDPSATVLVRPTRR